MRIIDVRTVLLTGPSSNDPWITFAKSTRSVGLVELVTDSGLTGLGETYAGYFATELVTPVVDYVAPILLAAETLDPRVLTERMRWCLGYTARVGVVPGILAAVEAALWDLQGKAEGVPVHELLGGAKHARLRGYATGGPSPWPPEQLVRKLDRYRELGFTAFKVATGWMDMTNRAVVDPVVGAEAAVAQEVAKVEMLRNHAGDDFGILLDGHMGSRQDRVGWDLEIASAVMQALEPYGLFFFEEPLPYEDPDAYAELTRRSPIPIAGGEQLTTAAEFKLWLSRGAFAVAQPDAAWCGIGDFLAVDAMAAERGTGIASHNWCAGVGVMQNLHAAFASQTTRILELLPDPGPLHSELWGDSLVIEGGQVLLPTAPGLGVTLTDETRNRYPYRPGHEEFASVPGKQMRS